MDNERLQEFFLLLGDKASLVGKKLWLALAISVIASIPGYFLIKAVFVNLSLQGYEPPKIIYSGQPQQPLQIISKGVLDLGGQYYSAYIKIRNLENDWGVPRQLYTAEFKTLGGTFINKVDGSSYVLPGGDKLIVLSRFHSPQKPEIMTVTLAPTHFIHKPDTVFDFELERQNLTNNAADGLLVSAGIKNMTPFTIKQVELPVAVYNNKNEIVAVNFTYINDVMSAETRTFQYSWGKSVAGAVRAEITPQINIFDRNIFETTGGVSPFDNSVQ